MTPEEAKEVIKVVFGGWPPGSKTAEALATIYAREDALQAEVEALKLEMRRIADLTEKWTDSLVSQVNEIARAALKGAPHE